MARIVPLAISFAALLGAAEVQAGSDVARNGNVGTSVSSSVDQPMLVITDFGNVREEPDAQGRIITTVPRGSRVTMIGTANGGGWAYVTVGGLGGYMDLVQLRRAPRESTDHPAVHYVEMKVELYSAYVHLQPTSDSPILVTLPRGSSLMVIDANKGWAHVQGHNFDGYMDLTALSDERTPHVTGAHQTPSQMTTTTASDRTSTPTFQSYSNAPPHQTSGFYEPPLRTVSGQGGTIYERPDPLSRVLGFLPPGRQVSFIGSVGNWAHVVANGIDGFMITSQLR
jgi:uncharacterized protein YgiM (DUF1202 family)